MGSTCCKQGEICPIHEDKTLQYICIQKNCIEPLCEKCLNKHRQNHELIGNPPNIVKYKVVAQVFESKLKCKQKKQKKQKNNNKYQFIASGFLLKELTNQYFTRRYKQKTLNKADQVHLNGIVEDLQLFQRLNNNQEVKQKFMKFLKQNLDLNQQIVGKDYFHLYN